MKTLRFFVCIMMGCSLALTIGCKKDSEPTPPPNPQSIVETEPNDSPAQAQDLGTGNTVTGSVTSSTSVIDVDRFKITLSSAASSSATLTWSGANSLNLAIQNSTGLNLTARSGVASPAACTLPLQPGTYFIEVSSTASSATPYTLVVSTR